MDTNLIGMYDNTEIAQKVLGDLREAGFKDADVDVLEGRSDKVIAEIVDRGFDQKDARSYAENASDGKKLIAVRVSENQIDRVKEIMDRSASSEESEETVPEVEENLSIAKRQVGRGGVRVTTRVSEKPVEKTVTLSEERVEAKHRSTDRELSPEQAEQVFQDKDIEITGTGEEVEVRKQARVVGEVSLTKNVENREQKVKDTVRRTEVDVEQIKADPKASR